MVRRGEIEKRHDPFYYIPRLMHLEKKVRDVSRFRLRDFIQSMAGGATPKTEEQEKYYSDQYSGIPFIRVQNLSINGNLQLDDVKYINRETNDKYLRRSRVYENNLLVKITGVGRMAVSSVPPLGFKGNINQHIVCIKTKNRLTSEVLAMYLNTDIAEALASRRSTGGTRPALDYGALRSIPIIYNESVLPIMSKANDIYALALGKAKKILASIDEYLLSELGIEIPSVPENTIESRIFIIRYHDLSGRRYDPLFHSFKLWHAIENSPNSCVKLGRYCKYFKSGFAAGGDMQLFDDKGVIQIRPTNISPDRDLVFDRNVYLSNDLLFSRKRDILKSGEVLFNNTNSQDLVGKSVFFNIENSEYFCSNHITRIKTYEDSLNPEFLAAVLNMYQHLKVFYSLCTNWNNQSGINVDLLKQLLIPLPLLEKQNAIASHISDIQAKAKRLRKEAEEELERTKRIVEGILISGGI